MVDLARSNYLAVGRNSESWPSCWTPLKIPITAHYFGFLSFLRCGTPIPVNHGVLNQNTTSAKWTCDIWTLLLNNFVHFGTILTDIFERVRASLLMLKIVPQWVTT
jgi:hypothetical protein